LIYENKIPVSEAVKAQPEKALNDGEDFELLFTTSQAIYTKLEKSWKFDVKLTKIGEIKDKSFGLKINRTNGQIEQLNNESWDHFKH
jgi:thiamine monophosphate kinase